MPFIQLLRLLCVDIENNSPTRSKTNVLRRQVDRLSSKATARVRVASSLDSLLAFVRKLRVFISPRLLVTLSAALSRR